MGISNPVAPSIQDVDRISALTDSVLRNLLITRCYYELAVVLAQRTGGVANWCTFATWASKQAGQSIRKEDLGRSLESALGSQASALQALADIKAAAGRLGARLKTGELLRLIWKAYDPQSVFERSSSAVARGNLKVFAEIAREFARFYNECLSDGQHNPENIDHFIEGLRPGDPPDGQQYLRQAFEHYYQALFSADQQSRFELMLLANIEIGFHEQTRLQPEILAALTTPVLPVQDFARNLFKVIRPEGGRLSDLSWFLMRLFGRLLDFSASVETYINAAQRQAQFLITETMMTIDLPPSNRLRLGDDLAVGFPPQLLHLSNSDLLKLLAQIDPTPDSIVASGAQYWGDLPDRIHFIADMFRCYQLSPDLLQPPFTPQQLAALDQGQIPAGRL